MESPNIVNVIIINVVCCDTWPTLILVEFRLIHKRDASSLWEYEKSRHCKNTMTALLNFEEAGSQVSVHKLISDADVLATFAEVDP